MRQKVQTLLCDRCGEPYYQDLHNEHRTKNVDVRCDLNWEDMDGTEAPLRYSLKFKDVCQSCAMRLRDIFATLVASREYDDVKVPQASAEEIAHGQKREKEEG